MMRTAAVLALLGGTALAEPPPSAIQRSPQKVYSVTCGYCHGRNVGPILLGRKLQPDYIRSVARTGPNGMPAFRPTEISDSELEALARWIAGSKADPKEHGK